LSLANREPRTSRAGSTRTDHHPRVIVRDVRPRVPTRSRFDAAGDLSVDLRRGIDREGKIVLDDLAACTRAAFGDLGSHRSRDALCSRMRADLEWRRSSRETDDDSCVRRKAERRKIAW